MSQQSFTPEEMERYSRHFVLPEVGVDGQLKLREGKVLIVGAGGLGSPVALYLAAAGIGRIGIAEFDTVTSSNLQRQILYTANDVGKRKSAVARERLESLNPHVEVRMHDTRLTSTNALDIIREYDIIADCTDNFPTRYLINDACVLTRRINVYGSVFRFEGQVSVFDASLGPCYRCIYPAPPPPELVQDCSQAGVLGVLPGIVGALQANEVVKLILAKGEPLVGRMVFVDALAASVQEMTVAKDKHCPVCGESPAITSLIDYEEFCSGPTSAVEKSDNHEMSVQELKRRRDARSPIFLLDVREPYEYAICNIGGHLIPLSQLESRLSEIEHAQEIIVYCHHGIRSEAACTILRKHGFHNVRNLSGGIDGWAHLVDPKMPRY